MIRALLHCKRKSHPEVDEAQDGARAIILDEAVSATVFSHAKHLNFFEGIDHVDYDLLKSIRGLLMATKCHEYLSGNGTLRFLTATEFFVFSAIIEVDELSSI